MAVLATAQITITDLLDGESAVLHSLATNVTSIQYDSLEDLMIPSSVDINAQVKTGGANPTPFGAYFLVYEQSRNSLTVDEYTELLGKSGTVVGEEYILSDTPYPYVLRYASQSTESELNYEIQTNAMGLYIEMYADADYSELLGMQTIPIVTDGFTSYMWVMYADDENGAGMSSSNDGKRYVGMAENQTVITPSTDPSKYRWSPLYDNVKIGVRNLLKLSDENVSTSEYLLKSYYMSETMIADEDYTISLKGTLPAGQSNWGIYLSGGSGALHLVNLTRKEGSAVYTATFKGKSSGLSEDWINVYNMPSNTSVASIEWIQLEKGNVASTYSQAPEDTKAEIAELSGSLGTLKNTTLPALEDELLNKAEQESVKQSLNVVESEKLDVDNQYTVIYGNASLTGTPKTNLYNAKVAYNTAHTNLKNSITAVVNVADGTRISESLITAVSSSFTNYSSAIATFRTRVEEANKSILDKQISDTTTTLSTNITNVSNATTALQNFTNTTFTDGVIQRAESKAIAEHLNTLTKENVDLINQYNTLNSNVLLAGTPKTNLGSAKTSYDTAYSALTTAINTAIADGKVTSTESASVATNFTAYGNSLKVFTQRLNEAVTAIADAAARAYTNSTVDTKTGRNMWVANKYEWANAARIFPKLSHIRGLKPSESKYMSDATSFTFSADYYIGHFYTYVYVNAAKTLNLTITHDDDCTIVVNDAEIYSVNATMPTAQTLNIPLKKGWNQIDMLLHEIAGGDSITLSALISSQVDDMSCYLGGGMSASQIRQLSDEIDLRVQRAGVINAINVSTEGIRLDGSKITVNGSTTFTSDVIMANGVIRSADGGTVLDLNNNTFSINKPFTIGSSTSATTTQVTTAQTTAISTAAADATTKANTAQTTAQSYADTQSTTALNSAKTYADAKATTAETAAKAYADAQLALEATRANSYADGIVTAEEQARIDALSDSLDSAKAYADAQAALAETQAKAYADGQIDAEEQARINEAVANLASAKTYAESQAATAQTTAVSTAQTYTNTQVSNIEIGGINLISGTKDLSSPIIARNKIADVYNGFSIAESSPTTGYTDIVSVVTPVLDGLEYTASFYAKSTNATQNIVCHFYSPNTTISCSSSTGQKSTSSDGNISVTITNVWTRYWVTWKQSSAGVTKSMIIGRITAGGNASIAGVKFEKGNKATDWTASAGDVEKAYTDMALAKAALAETQAKAYADGQLDAEEAARIAEATAKLNEAKTYAESQANTAKTTAISTAASDATTKANTALSSAQTYATTQANTALSNAQAYADTMSKVLTIDNTESTYFSFDKNLTASSGISPIAGYNATLVDGGKFGKAISNIGQKLHYDKSVLPLSQFTISGWFKPILIHTEQAGNTGISGSWWFPFFELGTPTNSSCVFSLSAEPDQAPTYNKRLKLQGTITGSGSTKLSNGAWYLITATFDGARYKVYLNGEIEINVANSTVLAPTAPSVLMVGGGYFGKPNVLIDDFVVSSNVFTQDEIRAIYTLQQPMKDPSPRVIAPTPSGITISIS